jgi:methanogenic corrinoid protein MtbC1
MAVDLLEASGYSVRFAGSGVANDEIQAMVQNDQPDVLLMFCSDPQNLPDIRALIDNLHEVGACPRTQIAVGGGVFNRAEGLAEEIGADLWAQDPFEMVDRLTRETGRRATPDQRTVGKQRPAGAVKAA